MTVNWERSREWIDRFEKDPDQVFLALETWLLCALGFVRLIGQHVDGQLPDKKSSKIRLPEYFDDLGRLIVSYCDISMNHIDAAPLLEFHREAHPLSRPDRSVTVPDHSRLVAIVNVCVDLISRIEFVVRHRNRSNQSDEVPNLSEKGMFDISIDRNARLVRREGFVKTVDLASRPCCWAVFEKLFEAAPNEATLETLDNNYPGDWNKNTAGQIYFELRKYLKDIEVTVEKRKLLPIED